MEKTHVQHYMLNKTAAEPKKMIEYADRDGLAGCNIYDNEHSGQL